MLDLDPEGSRGEGEVMILRGPKVEKKISFLNISAASKGIF